MQDAPVCELKSMLNFVKFGHRALGKKDNFQAREKHLKTILFIGDFIFFYHELLKCLNTMKFCTDVTHLSILHSTKIQIFFLYLVAIYFYCLWMQMNPGTILNYHSNSSYFDFFFFHIFYFPLKTSSTLPHLLLTYQIKLYFL